jgi:hypothetical protein
MHAVPAVLQRQRADLVLGGQEAGDPVGPRRDQPPFQLGQHRAADALAAPARGQADPHQLRAGPADGADHRADDLLADYRHDRGRVRAHGADQVGDTEHGRSSAGRRVIPQPDGRIEVILVEVADPPGRHRVSVPRINWPSAGRGTSDRQRAGMNRQWQTAAYDLSSRLGPL